ncbi:MAG TPA: hypothetical protein VLC46_06045 [Thermoanaerobaculia bacterium]|jgi:hypothetical protein|nr:hypothetical protein [Thermoanaerobaculia bacterium]
MEDGFICVNLRHLRMVLWERRNLMNGAVKIGADWLKEWKITAIRAVLTHRDAGAMSPALGA